MANNTNINSSWILFANVLNGIGILAALAVMAMLIKIAISYI